MTDPIERALERARAREEYPGDVTGDISARHPDANYGRGSIRMPSGRRVSYDQRGDTYLPYDHQRARPVDLTGVRTAHLDDQQKNDLLENLLDGHNAHTERTRSLQLESDATDLENKKRFSNLGYNLVKAAGIAILFIVLTFVGLVIYGTVYDKSVIETGLFSIFLNTFVEMLKLIFSVF